MSILLCSLLIGVGYDAYCVFGKAPKEITTRNEALMECLYKNKGKLILEYDKKVEEKKRDEQLEKETKANFIDDDEPDELQDGILTLIK